MNGLLAEIRSAAPMRSLKKMLGTRGVTFLRRCLHRNVPGLDEYQARLAGKRALEIGGPSELFSDQGCLSIYSVLETADNCLFSEQTIWTGKVDDGRSFQYHPARKLGLQLFCDGTDLQQISNSSYQAVLASHCLEHMANPFRALHEWKRVLTGDGLLLLILPHKDGTFDWRRPTTRIEHMIQDYEMKVGEDDLTHVQEILELHDLKKDSAAGSPEQFRQRCLNNKHTRAMHHHVFDTPTAAMLVDHAGFQLIRVATVKPFHIIILAAKCNGQKDNSPFFRTDAEFRVRSPFPSDRKSPGQHRMREMTKRCSIASVTVAYNGASALPRQLNALKRQTRKLDEVVVVNNASSDDSINLLQTNFPEVTILNQLTNIGVGGGFSAGLDYAANQRKHDWIWLLDQDSLPSDQCLEQLLEALDHLRDETVSVGILAPLCVNENTKLTYSGSIWRHGLREPSVAVQDQPISFVDSVISSGTLLRREAVEEVGLPRSDFFMDFVDHEYCLRLRRHGYKIAIVRGSRIDHVVGEPRTVGAFGFEKAWSSHAPWREYYMTRNEVFTVWKYDPDWRTKCVAVYRLLRHAMAVLLFGKQKLACLRMMCRGFTDGRAGRLGIRSFKANDLHRAMPFDIY